MSDPVFMVRLARYRAHLERQGRLGFPVKTKLQALAIKEVKADAAVGSTIGVNSTPAFFVDGKRIPGGGLPPPAFRPLDRPGTEESQVMPRNTRNTRTR